MMKKRSSARLALFAAATFVVAPLLQIRTGYAGAMAAKARPPQIPPKPALGWPSPCSTNPCASPDSPHWFYLQNVASVNAGNPLVLTVTTPPQTAQHNQPPPQQPRVTVGVSATGVTLQPINVSPAADNQMWYASEAAGGQSNPSYLISSLPADILPVAANSNFVTQQLALGYFGSPGASGTVTAVSSAQQALGVDGFSVDNTFGSVGLQGNPFALGQTIAIASTPNGSADGYWTIQQINANVLGYTIPNQSGYTPYNFASASGDAVAMAAVYLNQQNVSSAYLNPAYTNAFQQWSYDSGDLTICNGLGACLNSVDATPHAGSIVTASNKPSPVPPSFQWSFYPNPQFEEILSQTNIPFPTLKPSDYKKVNKKLANLGYADAAAAACTLDGVSYVGLRCQYSNLAAPLSAYLLAVARMKNITAKTKAQLVLELTDAIAVQNLFNQGLAVFTAVFLGNQDLISQDLGDLGMDITNQTSKKKFDWLSLVSGIVYTFLNGLGTFLGDPKLGTQTKTLVGISVVANLMSTGVDTYLGEQSSGTLPLANQFETTAADLYTNFYARFLNFYASLAEKETEVLSDWGKLALVGAMAQDTGPNGLAWDPNDDAAVIAIATQSYQLNLMAQLLPQFFTLFTTIDWVGGSISSQNVANGLNSQTTGIVNSDSQSGAPSPMPTPDTTVSPVPPQLLNQFATPVDPQGSQFGMWDAAWLHMGASPGNGSNLSNTYLTPQLAQDVQFANPYLLYNGFGLWSSFAVGPANIANLNCDGVVVTLTNYTPKALTVTAVSSENTAIGGGYGGSYQNDLHGDGGSFANLSNNSGIQGPVFRTLPPYGVLQLAGSTINGSGSAKTQTLTVRFWDYSTSTQTSIASFQVQNFGCNKGSSSIQLASSPVVSPPYGLVLNGVINFDNTNTPGLVGVSINGGS